MVVINGQRKAAEGELEQGGKEQKRLQLELRMQGWVGGTSVCRRNIGRRGMMTQRCVSRKNSSQKQKSQ